MDELFKKQIGYIITITIELEKQLDEFLSKHFCYQPNRQEEFKSLLLYNERITLDFKRELFTIIVKSEYKDLLTSHPTVLHDLGRLPEHRNRFAHLRRVNNDELKVIDGNKTQIWSGINGDKTISEITMDTIVFRRYKNGSVKYLGYGEKEIIEMKAQLSNIIYFLIDVYKEMAKRHISIEDERRKIKIEVLKEVLEELQREQLNDKHRPGTDEN